MALFNTQLFNTLNSAKKEAYEIVKDREKPTRSACAKSFLGRIGYAAKLIFQEKEIITFSIAQVIIISFFYYVFIQVLNYIPDEVWQSIESNRNHASTIADLVVFAWAIICIGMAAFPLGILSGAMAAVHFLHHSGKQATIASSIRIALSQAWSIWMFTWLDAFITVNRIMGRLPKKNDSRTASDKLLAEMLYYAWKLVTLGMLPALITGHPPLKACNESLSLLKNKTSEIITLRLGYSFFCWIIGILAYVGGVIFLTHTNAFNHTLSKSSQMIYFVTYAGVPIIIATAIVQLFLRPIYLISACEIYSEFLQEKGEEPHLPEGKLSHSAIFFFLLLCGLAFISYQYADVLGIKKLLATPYTEPIKRQFHGIAYSYPITKYSPLSHLE